MKRTLLLFGFCLLLSFGFTSCNQNAGEKLEDKLENRSDDLEELSDDLEDASDYIEEGTEDIEEAIENFKEALEEVEDPEERKKIRQRILEILDGVSLNENSSI